MLSTRLPACLLGAYFFVALAATSAFAQLETDPLPPEPPIDLGGTLSVPDLGTPNASLIDSAANGYSRSMRARQMSVNEPALRTTVTAKPTRDAPPSLELWSTTPSPPPQIGKSAKSTTRRSDVSQTSYEMPSPPLIGTATSSVAQRAAGFSSPITHPTSLATPLVNSQPYIPQAEHIPSVAYETHAQNLPSVSQPIQTTSYGVSSCDSYGGCSCGGCSGVGGVGARGGIFGGCLAGYGRANALPLGAASNAYMQQQIYNGERTRFTLYNYDFSDLGSADPSQLNRAGRAKLAKLVTPTGARSFVAHQIVVQPVLDNPSLSQARRVAALQFLTSRLGVDYGDNQVILAEPDYRGLRGVEAVEIDRNQLQNTRSFGTLGSGGQQGGGQGGGQGGSQIGGGSQAGQQR